MGQVVRLVLLLAMGGYTYWRIAPAAAGALAVEAIVVGSLAAVALG